jgi:hypothetical protein
MVLKTLTIFLLLFITPVNILSVGDSYFGITKEAYSQASKVNPTTADQIDTYKSQ